jgi:ActR/RegA family two-component response regulator
MAPSVRASVPLSVVCVEDDPDMVELLRISVEGERDFELVATTGEASAVLDLIREHHPDVVILDHRLSDRSSHLTQGRPPRGVAIPQTGLELVEGARVAAPEATIVIFTGRRGLGTAARNVGADAYVEKPALEAVWPAVREARASK